MVTESRPIERAMEISDFSRRFPFWLDLATPPVDYIPHIQLPFLAISHFILEYNLGSTFTTCWNVLGRQARSEALGDNLRNCRNCPDARS